MEPRCAEYRLEVVPEGRVLACLPDLRVMICLAATHIAHFPEDAERLRIRGYDEEGRLREQLRARPPRRLPQEEDPA